MSDLNIILLTAFFGIVGAIVGYTIISFLLEPVKDFRKEVRLLSKNFIKYRGISGGPAKTEFHNEASQVFKSARISLQSKYLSIPLIKIFQFLYLIPNEDDVKNATNSLLVLSGFIFYEVTEGDFKIFEFARISINEERDKVVKLLGIKTFKADENEELETAED